MYAIILCGGSGTRLWPLSRKNFPKQFLKLYSERSLLQETYLRMQKIMPAKNIIFVTNKANYFNVLNQAKEIDKKYPKDNILVEPASLNTAPAITYALKYLQEVLKADPKAPVMVLPSDHYIGNEKKYLATVKKSVRELGDNIGTIGITPLKPETGYGYIKKGLQEKNKNYFKVLEFKEKPDKKTAQKYLNSGKYVWNSGMYLFNARTFFEELKKYAPTIYNLSRKNTEEFLKKFHRLSSISLDYAISEKSNRVVVFEGDFGWSDIGSFDSLSEIKIKDKNPKHLSFDSKNIYTNSISNRLIVTVGVDDMNVIDNNDVILVQKKGKSGEIKMVTEYLKKHNYKEVEHNMVGYRPWGKYEVLIDDANHKVKKITVSPGAKLSLQSHQRRAEHWVVVKGTAKVVNGENLLTLHENESTYISARSKHQLANPGKSPLEIIEVQTGDYFGEDDIVRYKDEYDRMSGVAAT